MTTTDLIVTDGPTTWAGPQRLRSMTPLMEYLQDHDLRYRSLPPATDATHLRAERTTTDDGEEEQGIMFGHFARFGQWVEVNDPFEGRFMERHDPASMNESFANRGTTGPGAVKAIFNHGFDAQLGMKPLGSIRTLRAERQGPFYEVDLFPSVPDLLVDGLRAGVYGASYHFRTTLDDMVINENPRRSKHNPKGLPERTVMHQDVVEFGPTAVGQDPQATSGLRSDMTAVDPAEFREVLGVEDTDANREAQERAARLRSLTLKRFTP